MDPISLAIVAGISAGAISGVTDASKKAIVDGYEGLKTLIKSKLGGDSKSADAIEKFQDTPDSAKRKETLVQELHSANAAADPELLQAAESLLALIKALPQGERTLQQIAHGIGIAQSTGSGTASVNITGWPPKN